jgi:hypothetical protein
LHGKEIKLKSRRKKPVHGGNRPGSGRPTRKPRALTEAERREYDAAAIADGWRPSTPVLLACYELARTKDPTLTWTDWRSSLRNPHVVPTLQPAPVRWNIETQSYEPISAPPTIPQANIHGFGDRGLNRPTAKETPLNPTPIEGSSEPKNAANTPIPESQSPVPVWTPPPLTTEQEARVNDPFGRISYDNTPWNPDMVNGTWTQATGYVLDSDRRHQEAAARMAEEAEGEL